MRALVIRDGHEEGRTVRPSEGTFAVNRSGWKIRAGRGLNGFFKNNMYGHKVELHHVRTKVKLLGKKCHNY